MDIKQIDKGFGMIGKVRLQVFDGEKCTYDSGFDKNLIVNGATGAMAARAIGTSVPAFTYIAVGSGLTAAAVGDAALGTEIATSGVERVSVTPSLSTITDTNDTFTLSSTVTATGSATVNEIGIFNNTVASGTSIMLARKVLASTANIASGNTVTITYAVQFTN